MNLTRIFTTNREFNLYQLINAPPKLNKEGKDDVWIYTQSHSFFIHGSLGSRFWIIQMGIKKNNTNNRIDVYIFSFKWFVFYSFN